MLIFIKVIMGRSITFSIRKRYIKWGYVKRDFDISEQRKIIIASILMMLVVSITVLTVSLWLLYQSMFSQKVESLQTLVDRQINILQPFVIAELNNQKNLNLKSTIIEKNFSKESNFGKTGEFVLGVRRLDNIEFLSKFRFPIGSQKRIIPFNSDLAAPMRRALDNKSGWLIGQDYRGKKVLAAYQYLNSFDLGLVAKIDMEEVNAPFISAAIKASFVALVIVGIGGLLIFYITIPIIARLKASQKTFKSLIESSQDGIVIVNSSREIVYNNQNIEAMFGYLRHELINLLIEDLMPINFRENHPKMMASYFKNPSKRSMGFGMELFGLTKSGKTFPCEISLNPIQTEDGQAIAATIRDISDRKKLESRIILTEKMDAMSKISGGIAHEFNNLLAIIMGFSSLLKKKLVQQPELYKYSQKIHRAGERGAQLTNKMLVFSNERPIVVSVLDLNVLLKEQWETLKILLTVDVNLTSDFTDDPLLINVDESDLENTIINLCQNAKYAVEENQESSKITIRTSNQIIGNKEAVTLGLTPGDYVLLSIIDNGKGMDARVKKHIFEPFFSTKQFGTVTGLGLSQVFGLVKRSGGTISVDSDIEKGTKFVIYFPRYINSSEENNFISTIDTDDLSSKVRHQGNILIVDDEEALLESTSINVRERGYTIFTATSAKQALDIIKQESIDLMISDILMPEMDGFQLASIVQNEFPDIKIQLVSGFTDNIKIKGADKKLSDNILQKPYCFNELFKNINSLLKT